LGLGISPPEVTFEGSVGERICNEVSLHSSSNLEVVGKDRWMKGDVFVKDLSRYKSGADDLKIEVDYPKELGVVSREEFEVCVVAEKEGDYFGALIYTASDGPVGIGNWIIVRVSEDENSLIELLPGLPRSEDGRVKIVPVLLVSNSLLLFSFLMLISFRFRRKAREGKGKVNFK
tara:strand:- start:3251 stop:3775 length:525 start_codon:yes stop_codon:yes gene_type:complete